MLSLISSLATAGLIGILLVSPGTTAPPETLHKRAAIDTWIATESPIALQGVLNNIGPNGSKAPGAAAGIVVASPSTTSPDCKLDAILNVE